MGAETTNGDGFGSVVRHRRRPGRFHSIEPAWNDRNLRELAAHLSSGLVFAHIRASSGLPGPADELPPVSGTESGCGCTTGSLPTSTP
jgi:predicted glutamine amidotransferase